MKKYLAAALGVALSISLPAFGGPSSNYLQPANDQFTTAPLGALVASCTASGALLLKTQGIATVSVVVTGTFTGTLSFKGAADENVTYNSVNAYPQAGGAAVTTATSTGTWFISSAAYRWICVYMSAYTSGTATVTIDGSTAVQRNFSGADLATVAGGAIALGSAASAASLPVVIASDQGAVAVKGSGSAGTANAGVVTIQGIASMTEVQVKGSGSAGTANAGVVSIQGIASMTPVQGDIVKVGGGTLAADGVAIAGAPVPAGLKAVADAAAPTQVTAGQVGYHIGTLERIPIVTTRHPNHIQCQQTISTATSLTAMGGSCAAPGAGLSLYITDIDFSTNAAAIAADSFNTLKSGTGGTCGAATAVIWQCMTAAATQATCSSHLSSPIKVAANSEVCWINSTAGSKTINIEGYIAP